MGGASGGGAGIGAAGSGAAGGAGMAATGPGLNVAGSAGSTPNTGAMSSAVGVAGAAGAVGGFSIPAKTPDDGGCSVTRVGTSGPALPAWLLLLCAVVVRSRARRARRARRKPKR
jgi:hypothetical protein